MELNYVEVNKGNSKFCIYQHTSKLCQLKLSFVLCNGTKENMIDVEINNAL